MNKWQNLKNPPVVVALFQLKYNASNSKVSDFLQFDTQIRHNFPNRNDNIQVGINFGNSSISLGMSKISATSNAEINAYMYSSKDQKTKLEISNNSITYIDEHSYEGWNNFLNHIKKHLSIISKTLDNKEIIRTSIRFINRFTLNDFNNPQDYFKTLISSDENSQIPYPLTQSSFRLNLEIPNSDIYSIVNQSVEYIGAKYIYTFDIDVLDRQHIIFNTDTILENLENLRDVKNTIFFDNITQKTIDLCN